MFFLLLLVAPAAVYGLDNGLALTPPMGWLSWTRFACNTDCENDPKQCISEQLYKDMADKIATDGYKEAGYEYVCIDDCWMESERDSNGRLVADRKRFPSGIKALADYIHAKGLKIGIYEDIGTKTCAGYPGSYGHFDTDAQTFADWEIDLVKVDGCYADPKEMATTYPQFSAEVLKTQRKMLFSCEWPLYEWQVQIKSNYTLIAQHCNMWRNYHDIADSWENVLSIVDHYAENQEEFVPAAGPGGWNDPDMLLAGNFGLSDDETKAQFMLWAIFASPLLMSNDLRDIKEEHANLLKNKDILAVSQDKLGKMGRRIQKNGDIEIWTRPIQPLSDDGEKYSYAIVFLNRKTLGSTTPVSVQMSSIGLDHPHCYTTYDALDSERITSLCPKDNLSVLVNPSGATMIIAKINSSR